MFAKNRKNSRNRADQNTKRVYSYYSNTRLRDEEPNRNRRATKDRNLPGQSWWHHLPSYLSLAAILVCFGYILSINTNPKIVQISTDKSVFLHDKNSYQLAANKIISKSILNDNKVTFNVASISKQLKQEFPELSNVSITMPIINRRPVIYLTASQPAIVLITEDTSMIVDSRGVAAMPASQLTNLPRYDLLTVKDDSGLKPFVGQLVLPASSVKFILSSYQELKVAGYSVDQFTLPAIANELDVKIKGQKYYIKMNLEGDSREQAGAFLASVNKVKSLHDQVSKYYDVRVVGRVYYK